MCVSPFVAPRLMSLGYPISSSSSSSCSCPAANRAASRPDALCRLAWLHAHGCEPHADPSVAVEAACAGRLDALQWLLQPPPPPTSPELAAGSAAASAVVAGGVPCCSSQRPPSSVAAPPLRLGQAHMLQLAERGCGPEVWALVLGGGGTHGSRRGHPADQQVAAVTEELLIAGASCGNVRGVTWLLHFAGAAAGPAAAAAPGDGLLTAALFAAAAGSGSIELLEALWARGCPSDPRAYLHAAEAGSVACLDWLAAHGCPMGVSDARPELTIDSPRTVSRWRRGLPAHAQCVPYFPARSQ